MDSGSSARLVEMDALDAIHLHQHEPQLLVQLLAPQQVDAVIAYGLLFAIELYLCFLELSFMGAEQLFEADSGPLLRRPSPPGSAGAGLLVCGAGLFRLCDDLHMHAPAAIELLQLLKGPVL